MRGLLKQGLFMKIKPEHLAHMRGLITSRDTQFHRDRYKAAGLSDMRYRHDLLAVAVPTSWICDTLYPYLNDSHIDTALRSIVKPL